MLVRVILTNAHLPTALNNSALGVGSTEGAKTHLHLLK